MERPLIVRRLSSGATRPDIDRRQGEVRRQGSRPASRLGPVLASAAALAATTLLVRGQARRAEREHPPVGRFVEVDGVRVHYDVHGEGSPVVLLHGNGTLVQDWAISGLLPKLARHHRVISIDRPGFGYTERPRDRLWTADAQAELVFKALRQLGVKRPVVLGHSWGTLVALALALNHQADVKGLVLLSGYYFPTKRVDVWLFAPPAIPILGDAMRYTVSPLIGRAIAPGLIKGMFEPRNVPRRFKKRFPLDLTLRPISIKAISEDSALMVPSAAALSNRYGALRLPVSILAGDADLVVSPERQSARLHESIAQSELRFAEGIGHMIHYFAHDAIIEAVERVSGEQAPRVAGGSVAERRSRSRSSASPSVL